MIEAAPFYSPGEWYLLPSIVLQIGEIDCGSGSGLNGWQLRVHFLEVGFSLSFLKA